MKRTLIAIALLLSTASFAYAEADAPRLSVRTFQFKYKEADRAATAIKSLLSAEGSMSIQPGSNALVVTDRAENLKSIASAVAQFDAPARPVHLSIRIVSAVRGEAVSKAPDDLRDIAPNLAMLRFTSIESVGKAEVEGREGEPGMIDLANGYRAEFRFGEYDPTSDTIKLNDFRLSKLQGAEKDQLNQLYKASLNLKVGNTVIIGAGKPQGQRALMMVFIARR